MFFLSMEDDLLRLFIPEGVKAMVSRLGLGDEAIHARALSRSIESAQKQLEGQNFNRRKNVLSYDDVMNEQRKIIYEQRQRVLDGMDLREMIVGMISSVVANAVNEATASDDPTEWDMNGLRAKFYGVLCDDQSLRYTESELMELSPEALTEQLTELAMKKYTEREQMFGDDMREIERVLLLRSVDSRWMDHLDAMDDLKGSVGLHAYAQRNPISEFRIAAAEIFDEMIESIRLDTVRKVLSVVPAQKVERKEVAKVTDEGFEGGKPAPKKPVTVRAGQKIGPNQPCPCGSGKKYKKCSGKCYPKGISKRKAVTKCASDGFSSDISLCSPYPSGISLFSPRSDTLLCCTPPCVFQNMKGRSLTRKRRYTLRYLSASRFLPFRYTRQWRETPLRAQFPPSPPSSAGLTSWLKWL